VVAAVSMERSGSCRVKSPEMPPLSAVNTKDCKGVALLELWTANRSAVHGPPRPPLGETKPTVHATVLSHEGHLRHRLTLFQPAARAGAVKCPSCFLPQRALP
jgi:hypothetical protein